MGRGSLEPLADEHLQPLRRPVERIAFGHAASVAPRAYASRVSPTLRSRARAAAAGAAAATLWGLLEPLDAKLFRSDYRDIALLGKLVTSGRGWKVAGYALHGVNGALFGLGLERVRGRTGIGPRRLAVGLALAENVVLYPLALVADRFHPRRGERHLPPLWSRRVFAQETFRHAVFGLVLGSLAAAQE
jgi:hypothetical protein